MSLSYFVRAECVVLALLCLTITSEGRKYSNPVYPKDWPDPTVWRADDGLFYSTSTGQNHTRPLLCSKNLVDWEYSDIIPFDETVMAHLRELGVHRWAPDLAVVNGCRILYFSVLNNARDSKIVALRETDKPGHFEYVGVVTDSNHTGIPDTIDPEVITDPTTGKVWMFFGSIGRMHRVQLTQDGTRVADDAEYEVVAGLCGKDCPSRSQVFEGAYLHFHDGWWYLFVSSGWYNNHTYQIKVGRSRTLEGEFVGKDGRRMKDGWAIPILCSEKGDYFFGPGHNAEIFTDKKGQDWILYHCHVGDEKPKARPMMLQRIFWGEDGWPYFKQGRPSLWGNFTKFQ